MLRGFAMVTQYKGDGKRRLVPIFIVIPRAKVPANFKRMRGWLIYVHTMT